MKYILVILIWIGISLSVHAATEKVKVHGTIEGLGNGEVVLLNSSRVEIGKVKGNGNKFEIVVDVETSKVAPFQLYVPSVGPLGPSMSIPTLFFLIDSQDVEIQANIKEEVIHGEQVKRLVKKGLKGSAAMDEYESIFKNLPVRKVWDKISADYEAAFEAYNFVAQTEENMKKLERASKQLDSLYGIEAQQLLDLIPSKKDNKVMAFIAYNYFNSKPANELEEIYNQFDASIRDCYGLQEMRKNIDMKKNCEIGSVAPEFELVDLKGNKVKLSSLRGKYVLIDFWASWCGPCRKEIPNIKKVYADYKNRGLQVLGVSLDDSEEKWREAVKEEQLDYLQLLDAKAITTKLYNFQGIPFIILISPEGVILEKGLRGEDVRKNVAKYIK